MPSYLGVDRPEMFQLSGVLSVADDTKYSITTHLPFMPKKVKYVW